MSVWREVIRKAAVKIDSNGYHHLTENRVDDASVVGELLSQFSDQV